MQVCILLQTDNHASTPTTQLFTGRMPVLPPNQQRQSTEGKLQVQYTIIYCMFHISPHHSVRLCGGVAAWRLLSPRRSRLPVSAPPGGQTARTHDARRRPVRRDAAAKAPPDLLDGRAQPRRAVPDTTVPLPGRDRGRDADDGPGTQLECTHHVCDAAHLLPRRRRHARPLTARTLTLLARIACSHRRRLL